MTIRRFSIGDGVVDLEHHCVKRRGQRIGLTKLETRLLRHLATSVPNPVSREELLAAVWGYAPSTRTQTLEQAVRRVRRKVEIDPSAPRLLLTERGIGYRLSLPYDATNGPSPASPVTPLVGRTDVVAQVRRWLAQGYRLVTIKGPGGIGKTRLAQEIVRLETAGDRAPWFVEVASARSLVEVYDCIVRALGIEVEPDRVPTWLARAGPGLLVLDNVEAVAHELAGVARDWLSAGHLQVLTTSRCRLGVRGEQLLELGPLPLDDAVVLWRDRTEGVANTSTVAAEHLVGRLDGIPLAIELAAARPATLAIPDLLASLDMDPTGAPGHRHGSLDACLQWSWEQLPPEARRALHACTAFEGGWTPDAFHAVVGPTTPGDRGDGGLGQLVDHSMAQVAIEPHGAGRGRLLDVVRRFLVRERGEPADDVRDRHVRWCVTLGDDEAVRARAAGPRRVQAARRELGNLEAALTWALHRGDATSAARLGCVIAELLRRQPRAAWERLGAVWQLEGLAAPLDVDRTLAEVDLLIGLHRLDEATARLEALERRVSLRRRDRARAHLAWSWLYGQRFHWPEQHDHASAALALSEADEWMRASALRDLAVYHLYAHDPAPARRRLLEASAMNEASGRKVAQGSVTCCLGLVALLAGDVAGALESFERARALAHAFGIPRLELDALWRTVTALQGDGRGDTALEVAREALEVARGLCNPLLEGYGHVGVGEALLAVGREGEARPYLDAAASLALRHQLAPLADRISALGQ